MPKYQNTGTEILEFQGIRFDPGQTKTSHVWLVTPLHADIVKLTDAPIFDVVILSQKITAGVTVAVPASVVTNYKINVYCTAGDVTIKTDITDAVARTLGAGMEWGAICLQRTINSLIFTVSGGTAYLTIEKI